MSFLHNVQDSERPFLYLLGTHLLGNFMYNFKVYFVHFVINTVFIIIGPNQSPIYISKMFIPEVFIWRCSRAVNQASEEFIITFNIFYINTV